MCQASSGLWNPATNVLVACVLLWAAWVAASLGPVAVLLGLVCLRSRGRPGCSSERSTNVAGEALFFLAGLAMSVPVSYVAGATARSFWGPDFPTHAPRGTKAMP